MITRIKNNSSLCNYLSHKIEDEGIEVGVDSRLSEDEYIGIKIDDYYNGLKQGITPKAVDFVVVVDDSCDTYDLYILEMKNVKAPKFLSTKDIQEKFTTTIYDFLAQKFKDIFMCDRYKYRQIKLYLVSDAYGEIGKYQTHKEYLKYLDRINKRDSLKVDRNLGGKIYRFRNKFLRIEYDIPPNPVIKKTI